MSTLRDQRQVYALRIRPTVWPRAAKPIPVLQMCQIIETMWKEGKATFYISEKGAILPSDEHQDGGDLTSASNQQTNAIYIADVKIDGKNKAATILFNRGDADRSDPAYLNPKTKKIRVPERNDDESMGFSAHLVLSLDEDKCVDGAYRCTFERVPSITRSDVTIILNRLLRIHAEGSDAYIYKNKKDEEIHYRPRFDVSAQPAISFKEDMKNNVLRHVTLIKNGTKFDGVDNGNRFTSVTHMVRLTIDPKENGKPNLMGELFGMAKSKGFDEIQVEVFDKAHSRLRKPRFATEQADAADVLYARVEVIDGFSRHLDQCCEVINAELVDRMLKVIKDNEVWGG